MTWALGTGTDLRQIALVFDWCQDLLSPVQSRAIAAKLAKGIEQTGRDRSISALRSRVLAAVALADHQQAVSERELERVIQGRWRGEIAPELQRGRDVIPHDDYYPLYEMLHAVRADRVQPFGETSILSLKSRWHSGEKAD